MDIEFGSEGPRWPTDDARPLPAGWLIDRPVAFAVTGDQDRYELVRACLTIGHDRLFDELDGGLAAWADARFPVLVGGPAEWVDAAGAELVRGP